MRHLGARFFRRYYAPLAAAADAADGGGGADRQGGGVGGGGGGAAAAAAGRAIASARAWAAGYATQGRRVRVAAAAAPAVVEVLPAGWDAPLRFFDTDPAYAAFARAHKRRATGEAAAAAAAAAAATAAEAAAAAAVAAAAGGGGGAAAADGGVPDAAAGAAGEALAAAAEGAGDGATCPIRAATARVAAALGADAAALPPLCPTLLGALAEAAAFDTGAAVRGSRLVALLSRADAEAVEAAEARVRPFTAAHDHLPAVAAPLCADILAALGAGRAVTGGTGVTAAGRRACPAAAAAAAAAAARRSAGGAAAVPPRMDVGGDGGGGGGGRGAPAGAVILCPGQGAQTVGMASAWADASPAAAAVLARADAALGTSLPGGVPLSTLMREGPKGTLDRTDVAQPAIFVASMAALAGAREMGEAADASDGGMLALVGATEEVATAIVAAVVAEMGADTVLVAANFNAPGQVVLSGSTAAIARAEVVAKAPPFKLRRAIVLDVAGAFHSPLMAPAAARLAAALADVPIAAPSVPVMANVAGAAHVAAPPDRIRNALVAQLTSPVRWAACCQALATDHALGGGPWLELAPGKTLGGMMRKINPTISVVACAEPAAAATA
ncbi:hypothetical protein I4F81_001388 [Pyropia yezoensis]|uniref:Uncharacterized protein n=1 Tax=Pyropia yezoensis TaxID=2788 RepID=A0ACC3BLK1_PYRYE|nr:hypothetical protein I4F81_001388 [Neopyropia yezoensis]